MGRLFTLPDSRNGWSYGAWQIVVERGGFGRRHHRVVDRDDSGVRALLDYLPADRPRKAVYLAHSSGVFPDHVRADRAVLGLCRIFCLADHEWAAALVSSDVQLVEVQPRD